jgi:chromosomal replication initiation ATPase DnaA
VNPFLDTAPSPSVVQATPRAKRLERRYPVRHGAVDDDVRAILAAAARQFGTSAEVLLGRGRSEEIAGARNAVAWVAWQTLAPSYPDLGRRLGGRDHKTVMHLVASMDDEVLERTPRGLAALELLAAVQRKWRTP